MQGLVSNEEGENGESSVGGPGANLRRDGASRGGGGMRGGRIERDIREDDEYLYDESRLQGRSEGLFAALEEADKRHQNQRGRGGKVEEKVEMVKCPVCGEFEGDEMAVAHHVESHFGS